MLDNLDIQILNIIQSNARVSQADVARAVGLAPSAVLERLRKLEAKGVLTGYAALLDPEAIGLGQLAFVAVRTAGPLDVTIGPASCSRKSRACWKCIIWPARTATWSSSAGATPSTSDNSSGR